MWKIYILNPITVKRLYKIFVSSWCERISLIKPMHALYPIHLTLCSDIIVYRIGRSWISRMCPFRISVFIHTIKGTFRLTSVEFGKLFPGKFNNLEENFRGKCSHERCIRNGKFSGEINIFFPALINIMSRACSVPIELKKKHAHIIQGLLWLKMKNTLLHIAIREDFN